MTITPLADGRGRVTRLLYHAADLTGLRSAEERFERLFDLSPVPLSIVRLSDNVRLQANAAWVAFHGYAREQAIGQSSARQTRWVDLRERERMVTELRREGKVPGRRAQFVSPEGGVSAWSKSCGEMARCGRCRSNSAPNREPRR